MGPGAANDFDRVCAAEHIAATPENLHEAMGALNMLSLASVTIGDYVVVTNSREDVTIAGEPYLALQLWLNVRSGRVISRIWGQGGASQSSLSHFVHSNKIFSDPMCNIL